MTSGWLFDTYPVGDKMVSWIKNDNSITRIEDIWTPSIYVARDNISDLEKLSGNKKILTFVTNSILVNKIEKVTDREKSKVLQLRLKDSNSLLRLAKEIESSYPFGTYRLYNVDVLPAQSYFYEHDIFPMGQFIKNEKWIANDDVSSTDYDLPNFEIRCLSVIPKKQGRLAKFSDKIKSISLGDVIIESNDESEIILQLVSEIKKQDPDFVITQNGDSFEFPYLIHKAQEHHILNHLVLGRENVSMSTSKQTGTSYFLYGRMYCKPSAIKLLGRIHIDTSNCFLWNGQDDLHGLYEISRICRMPLQTTARASIGKCMSSLQFYNATKRGLLIPWKPTMAEAFKSRYELLIGDRGGLIFEPEVGVHENVAELDFASLYGSIIEKKNISAETILCSCCHDSENKVPELNYNICSRRGIVPKSLEILLQKRKLYSTLLAESRDDKNTRIYDARKSALKWILVTSFGYLGFNNAKFGRIDAHMAVCAFARQILLQAVRIAESHGFKVLHGIVDSIWIYKKNSTREECERVRDDIVKQTNFELSLDIYKWLVFLASKESPMIPVANRYFGVFESGKLKIRGIEIRRHDTPLFFKKCQQEMLDLMATGKNISHVRSMGPQLLKIHKKYLSLLKDHKVSAKELVFTIGASKNVEDYKLNSVQKDTMMQLQEEGEYIKAGQKIRYVIIDYDRKQRRSAPLEMIKEDYDVKRYAKLLTDCCMTMLKPFGIEILHEENTLG